MCISAEEVQEINQKLDALDDLKFKAVVGFALFILGNLAVFVGYGMWLGDIRADVDHNISEIAGLPEDRAEVLETRINSCERDQLKYEDSLKQINEKLDRIIESQLMLHGYEEPQSNNA